MSFQKPYYETAQCCPKCRFPLWNVYRISFPLSPLFRCWCGHVFRVTQESYIGACTLFGWLWGIPIAAVVTFYLFYRYGGADLTTRDGLIKTITQSAVIGFFTGPLCMVPTLFFGLFIMLVFRFQFASADPLKALQSLGAGPTKRRSRLGWVVKWTFVFVLVTVFYVLSAAPVQRQWGAAAPAATRQLYWPVAWLTKHTALRPALITWSEWCSGFLPLPKHEPAVVEQPLVNSEEQSSESDATLTDEQFAAQPADPTSPYRVWTDHHGRKVEAVLLESHAGQVRLKTRTGKTATIAADQLSEADQAFARQMETAATEPPAP